MTDDMVFGTIMTVLILLLLGFVYFVGRSTVGAEISVFEYQTIDTWKTQCPDIQAKIDWAVNDDEIVSNYEYGQISREYRHLLGRRWVNHLRSVEKQ